MTDLVLSSYYTKSPAKVLFGPLPYLRICRKNQKKIVIRLTIESKCKVAYYTIVII